MADQEPLTLLVRRDFLPLLLKIWLVALVFAVLGSLAPVFGVGALLWFLAGAFVFANGGRLVRLSVGADSFSIAERGQTRDFPLVELAEARSVLIPEPGGLRARGYIAVSASEPSGRSPKRRAEKAELRAAADAAEDLLVTRLVERPRTLEASDVRHRLLALGDRRGGAFSGKQTHVILRFIRKHAASAPKPRRRRARKSVAKPKPRRKPTKGSTRG